MIVTVGNNEVRSELEPRNVKCDAITTVEQMRSACRLNACTPDAIVDVNTVHVMVQHERGRMENHENT